MATTPDQLTQRLQPGRLITLYELDLTKLFSKFNGSPGQIWYFHDGINIGNETFDDGSVTTPLTKLSSATANFQPTDIGKVIVGTGIATTPTTTSIIAPYISTTQVNLSQAATAGTGLAFTIVGRSTNLLNFKGNVYNPFPILATNFEWNTRGTLPHPSLSVSNIGSAISALMREFGDFIGGVLTQRRTFDIYLDNGVEHGPPYKEFTPLIFIVDQKTMETNVQCSFSLATGFDAEGVILPRRQVLATACPWIYRGTECTYVGRPISDRIGAYQVIFGSLSKTGGNTATDGSGNSGLYHPSGPFLASDVGLTVAGYQQSTGNQVFANGTKIKALVNSQLVTLTQTVRVNATNDIAFTVNRLNDKGLWLPLSFSDGVANGTTLFKSNTAGFVASDVGKSITGTFIPPNTTIQSRVNATTVTLSHAATGSGTHLGFTIVNRITYSQWDFVYVMVNGIRVYAVSIQNQNVGHPIYDENWWKMDVCLKKLTDCEMHFSENPALPGLPYGGFPGAAVTQ